MNLASKVVIVTGASSGIGAATSVALSKLGAIVVLVARNKNKLQTVKEECKKAGGKSLVLIADLSDDKQVKGIVRDTVDKLGKIDVLINNAGFAIADAAFTDKEAVQIFDKIHAVNLRGVVALTHEAIPHLIKTKGNIVNISSVAAFKGLKGFWAYSTLKAGLDHFSRCIAGELAPHGVRVNVVNPGPVKTDIVENMGYADPEKFYESIKEMTALNRISEPDEIADMIVFLASDKARGVTGSNWISDCGFMVKL